jgi:D-alanyl-lipoteichoic acid acyltransferase DltB (MBOAT superfamily)
MTLSRWLRDYLYIGLGGNRHGRLNTYRNLILTMLLGGLWHGANWTFVAWGAYHGVLLAAHKLYLEATSKVEPLTKLREHPFYKLAAIASTFFLVSVGWVLFRAPTFEAARSMLERMFMWLPHDWSKPFPDDVQLALRLMVVLVAVHVFGVYRVGLHAHRGMPPAARGLLWAAMVAGCYLLASGSPVFIYFQF